jgi:hypothetical protein
MPRFLYLELLDPDVDAVLGDIVEIVSGRRPTAPFHLTLRGPYAGQVPKSVVARCVAALSHDVLRIGGAGRFSNPSEEVTYLRVDSAGLREVWWKPEYPVGAFGFEPHLSIYRGRNADLADALAGVLGRAEIDLLCAETRVVIHGGRQRRLSLGRRGSAGALQRLASAGRVRVEVLDELRAALAEFH